MSIDNHLVMLVQTLFINIYGVQYQKIIEIEIEIEIIINSN